MQGDLEKAADTLSVRIGPGSVLAASGRATLASKAAGILSGRLSRHRDAADLLAGAISGMSTNEPAPFAQLANQQAEILFTKLSDADAAEERVREVISLGSACPGPAFMSATYLLNSVYRAKGDGRGAVAALMSALARPDFQSPGFARRLVESGADRADLERAVGLLRKQVASFALNDWRQLQSRVDVVQPEIVEMLLAMGGRDEAVRECRVALFCTASQNYRRAVDMTAGAVKSLDGHLGRVNAFLEFQGADPASLPSSGNVLMSFPALSDEVRTGLRRRGDSGHQARLQAGIRHFAPQAAGLVDSANGAFWRGVR